MRPAALAIALAAFLLFLIQPLIGKVILPWFGGTPGVWTCIVLFFQSILLAGYAYAHWMGSRIPPARQPLIHLGLVAVAIWFAFPVPGDTWRPDAQTNPTFHILLLLGRHLALPGLILASTSPLLQHWLATRNPGREPYRLFAFSNAGSLLALFLFPLALEPLFSLSVQETIWSGTYVFWCLLLGAVCLKLRKPPEAAIQVDLSPPPAGEPPDLGSMRLWFLLSMCGNTLMLSITNKITLDIAAVPLLWTLPLGIYLLTFIIAFDHPRWYRRRWAMPGYFTVLPIACMGMLLYRVIPGPVMVSVFLLLLFFGCMLCHGELSRHRPDPRFLTGYYLTIASGGVAGGMIVGMIAPVLWDDYNEYPLSLIGVVILLLFSLHLSGKKREKNFITPRIGAGMASSVFLSMLALQQGHSVIHRDTIHKERSFFGTISIHELERDGRPHRILRHGNIIHGMQLLDEGHKDDPTINFAPESGIGRILSAELPKPGPRKVGIIGLGTGTLASFSRAGDKFIYFEIDPAMVRIARDYFSFLEESKGTVEILEGDARILLEQAPGFDLDLLIVDAFSSDAIPLHLLTGECFALYQRHLKPDGILLAHISNRFLDLRPAILAGASSIGREAHFRLYQPPKSDWWHVKSLWSLSTLPDQSSVVEVFGPLEQEKAEPQLLTDDHSSLIHLLK